MPHFYDTLLGEYINNPGARGLGLDKLAVSYFDYEMIAYEDVTQQKKINFRDVSLERASVYSGEDVYMTARIFEKQKASYEHSNVLYDIEMPLLQVLKKMEMDGVKIDRDKLKEIGTLLENEILILEKKIFQEAGGEFNINSPKQVGELLFERLGLPKGKKTKTGYSVGEEVLSDLAAQYEIARYILEYRHYAKILGTYVNGMLPLLDEHDFLHTTYNQFIAATGRLSSTNPGLQNIPAASSGIAGEVRRAFISRYENGYLLAFDYSQIEVRLLGIISQDQNLIDAFASGVDIHQRTAEFIFGTSQISSDQRRIAKAVNFGVIYGISGFGLSKMIDIPVAESTQYIKTFFASYPKVKEYLDTTIKNAEINKYVETIFGRKRYITGINDANQIIKKAAEREAINMPIQGTSADIIKIAMIQIYSFLLTPYQGNMLQSKLIMQVHDELVFDVFPGEEEILKKEVKEIMEGVLKNKSIPLKVDIGMGKTRKDAK